MPLLVGVLALTPELFHNYSLGVAYYHGKLILVDVCAFAPFLREQDYGSAEFIEIFGPVSS